MSDSNQAALCAALEAFNDPNRRQEYLDIYAPDVILHGYPRGLAGLEGARSFYSQLWRVVSRCASHHGRRHRSR